MPSGRYQLDAQTDSGVRRVRGLTEADDAPFAVQALSTTGNEKPRRGFPGGVWLVLAGSAIRPWRGAIPGALP